MNQTGIWGTSTLYTHPEHNVRQPHALIKWRKSETSVHAQRIAMHRQDRNTLNPLWGYVVSCEKLQVLFCLFIFLFIYYRFTFIHSCYQKAMLHSVEFIELSISNELERTSKEVVLAWCEVLLCICLEELRGTMRNSGRRRASVSSYELVTYWMWSVCVSHAISTCGRCYSFVSQGNVMYWK